jgi:glycosyltransferase involved in cell wall biosynthesis
MRIIINARFLTQQITGVQRFAIEISKALKKIKPSIEFVSPIDIVHPALAAELNVKVIGHNKGVVWEQIDLPIFLRKNKYPLLINLCNAAPLFYNNKVVTIHDVAFMVNPAWFNKKFILLYKFLIPRIAKKSKAIFTVSNFSKKEIIKYIKVDEDKIKIVYNGISCFSGEEQTDNKYGRYILSVGSIDKRKNISALIEAFKNVKDKSLKLLIVGDVNIVFNNRKSEILKSDERINFIGRVNDADLKNLYLNALIFIYPSLYEGFGIPPLEAMYCNCPTIVSDIGSLNEICGNASIYIDPYNPEDITQKVEILLNDEVLRHKLIEKGKQNIKKYSWEKSASLIANTIEHLN